MSNKSEPTTLDVVLNAIVVIIVLIQIVSKCYYGADIEWVAILAPFWFMGVIKSALLFIEGIIWLIAACVNDH